jgi:hypothetical protein
MHMSESARPPSESECHAEDAIEATLRGRIQGLDKGLFGDDMLHSLAATACSG